MDISNDTWHVIHSYFDETHNYLTKHHIDSYNDFLLNRIPSTFKIPFLNPQRIFVKDKKNPNIDYEMSIYYGGKDGKGLYMSKPTIFDSLTQTMRPMFPNECRLKNLSYAANLFADIEIEYSMLNDKKYVYENVSHPTPEILKKVNLGRIPIMLRSKACVLNDASGELLKQMGESEFEHGGYFVVDGMEKVIISQERKAENKLYINKSSDDNYEISAHVKSVPKEDFLYAKTTFVHLMAKTKTIAVAVTYLKKGNKSFDIPLFVFFRALGIESDEEILKFILCELKSEKSQYFIEILRASIEEAESLGVYDQLSALTYLEKYPDKVSDELERGGNEMKRNKESRLSFLYDAIYKSFFPHVGDSFQKKAYYLGYVVNELLHVAVGLKPETDRDSWRYKRIDLSGFLLANLFREKVMKLSWTVRTEIERKYEFGHNEYSNEGFKYIINETNLTEFFDFKIIENGFKDAFKIGEITKKKGLIQSVQRLSNYWMISYLRRVNTPDDNDLGTRIPLGQRMLHGTQYGLFCIAETPDGSNIGIKKHLTIMSHVTFGSKGTELERCIANLNIIQIEDIHPSQIVGKTKIFINGDWIGITEDPNMLVKTLRNLRRNGLINVYTSIAWRIQDMEIHCYTDGGRACYPLYVVENNRQIITPEHIEGIKTGKFGWTNMISGFKKRNNEFDYFTDYIEPEKEGYNTSNLNELNKELERYRGVVEYMDVDELDTCLVAPSMNITQNILKRYTHGELHPSLILGVLGFTIPFMHHSQAPRNVYGAGQNKQSVSFYVDNYRNRMETGNVLYHPQKPLITTRMKDYFYTNKLPTGQNAIVAIATYCGYNQEDSLIFNWSALQRGLFLSTYYKTYQKSEIDDIKSGTDEKFYNPTKLDNTDNENTRFSKKFQGYSFDHLDEYGFIKEGTYLKGKEILIGSYANIKTSEGVTEQVDVSVPTKSKDAIVDKVFTCYTNNNRSRMCKVRTAQERVPEFGDKFASRHGQKGTIGMRFLHEDMPFTANGITPDIIVNPHAIPSRMTLGQLIECIYGKCCAELGFFGDANPYDTVDKDSLCEILEKNGMQKYGDEILYNGLSGEQMKVTIFMGPTYYQRLKHMVRDKINSRPAGSRDPFFNMPGQGGGYTARERQPPGGKALDGGLRIGEMERDAVLGHGAQLFLKEAMMERSDKFQCYVCNTTGRIAVANPFDNIYFSLDADGPVTYHLADSSGMDTMKQQIENSTYHKLIGLNVFHQKAMGFSRVQIPYTMKLLIQECESIGISLRLIPESNAHQFGYLPIENKLLKSQHDVDDMQLSDKSNTKIYSEFTMSNIEDGEDDKTNDMLEEAKNDEDFVDMEDEPTPTEMKMFESSPRVKTISNELQTPEERGQTNQSGGADTLKLHKLEEEMEKIKKLIEMNKNEQQATVAETVDAAAAQASDFSSDMPELVRPNPISKPSQNAGGDLKEVTISQFSLGKRGGGFSFGQEQPQITPPPTPITNMVGGAAPIEHITAFDIYKPNTTTPEPVI